MYLCGHIHSIAFQVHKMSVLIDIAGSSNICSYVSNVDISNAVMGGSHGHYLKQWSLSSAVALRVSF